MVRGYAACFVESLAGWLAHARFGGQPSHDFQDDTPLHGISNEISYGAFCAALAATTPAVLRAQGGRLDARTEYEVIQGTMNGSHHGPLLAIVLWRGEVGWPGATSAERSQADSVFRYAKRDAEDRHLSFFGSGFAYGLLSDDRRQLTVESRTFDIVRTDSALVIMVSVPDFGLPRAVTTSRISADAVPDAFWPKTWQSGDTTFFVRPRYPRDVEMLRRGLETSPVVRDFLR